jgi:hypothetical protein
MFGVANTARFARHARRRPDCVPLSLSAGFDSISDGQFDRSSRIRREKSLDFHPQRAAAPSQRSYGDVLLAGFDTVA